MVFLNTVIFFLFLFNIYLNVKLNKSDAEAKFNAKIGEHYKKEFFGTMQDIEDSMKVVNSKAFLKMRLDKRAGKLLEELLKGAIT